MYTDTDDKLERIQSSIIYDGENEEKNSKTFTIHSYVMVPTTYWMRV